MQIYQHPLIERGKVIYYQTSRRDAKHGIIWPQIAHDNWALEHVGDKVFVVATGGWGSRASDEVARWRVVGDRLVRVRLD